MIKTRENTRSLQRRASTDYLNSLGQDELFERFAITRVSKIDGLDCIGVPVYSVCRPAAKVVSVNAGKSLDGSLARAGAVAEGIEFAVFENPVGPWEIGTSKSVDPDLMPTCSGVDFSRETPIAQELVTHYASGEQRMMPSDLVWVERRIEVEDPMFLMSSNGQSVGASFEDAFLQGLCECVERDQTVLRSLTLDTFHVWSPKIQFESELKDKCAAAGLKMYLFYCTYDIPFPVYQCILVDPYGGCGTYGGWGCDLNPCKAAERALLEAIQSRAVYISGSRDDIERRDYAFLKAMEPEHMIQEIESLPVAGVLPDFRWEYSSLPDELDHALDLLGPWKDKIYFKHIDLGEIHAVKTIVLGLEQPRGPLFRSMRWEKMRMEWVKTLPVPEDPYPELLSPI